MEEPKQVVVIGAGVIGLTAAYVLSSRHPRSRVAITIIARDMPDTGMDSTGWSSPWAGANWFPFLNQDPENRWERISFQKFTNGEVPQEFVMDLPSKYYTPDANRLSKIWYQDIVKEFGILAPPFPESAAGTPLAHSGFKFTTISINVPRYLAWLQDELRARGTRFVNGWISSVEDVEFVPGLAEKRRTDVVVNASGLGAKNIIGIADPLVFPIRGQTILVRAPKVRCCLMIMGLQTDDKNKDATYLIPRNNGDVIVGGTFQEGDWDVSPDPETARSILEKAFQYCPELSASDPPRFDAIQILRHNVGLRPARKGGARVEKELVLIPIRQGSLPTEQDNAVPPWHGLESIGCGMIGPESREALGQAFEIDSEPKRVAKVVHAYGAGPAGYQESWGIAEDVAKMVEEFMAT